MENPQEKLAQMYVDEYLRGKGLTMQTVLKLPEPQAKKIMTEASTYAAMKLCEVERKAAIVHEIHGAAST